MREQLFIQPAHPKDREWDLDAMMQADIMDNGGHAADHTHAARSFTINRQNLHLTRLPLKRKWEEVRDLKKNSSVTEIADRMRYTYDFLIAQGATVIGDWLDSDEYVGDKNLEAATIVRPEYPEVTIKYINQVTEGVLDKEAYKWFERGAKFVDIIGGLPAKDEGREDEHYAVLMQTAKAKGPSTRVHIHLDQFNSPFERETEAALRATRKYGMQDRVVGIHGISLSAQPISYQEQIIDEMVELGFGYITCPTAWIDSPSNSTMAVSHGPLAPVLRMIRKGVVVGIGPDNIRDIYKPRGTGNLLVDLNLLMDVSRVERPDGTIDSLTEEEVINIATINGRKLLGVCETASLQKVA